MMQRKAKAPPKKTHAKAARELMGRLGFPAHKLRMRCRQTIKLKCDGSYWMPACVGGERIGLRFKKWNHDALFILAHELMHYTFHSDFTSRPDYEIEYEAEVGALWWLKQIGLYKPMYERSARAHVRSIARKRNLHADEDYHRGWDTDILKWCRFTFRTKPLVDRRVVRYQSIWGAAEWGSLQTDYFDNLKELDPAAYQKLFMQEWVIKPEELYE